MIRCLVLTPTPPARRPIWQGVEDVVNKFVANDVARRACVAALRLNLERTAAAVPAAWEEHVSTLAKLGALPPAKLDGLTKVGAPYLAYPLAALAALLARPSPPRMPWERCGAAL